MVRVTSPTTRFTAAEFDRMAEAGVFGERRVELINGRIYRLAPQNDPHMSAVSRVTQTIVTTKPAKEWLVIQGTLRLDRNTTVDPEFMWYSDPIGTPVEVRRLPLLLIEVSDTTYRIDSGIKLRKYAKIGIRDYWIVNVRADRLEVYRDPIKGPRLTECRFGSVTLFSRGQTISPLDRPAITFNVADLLP